MDFVIRRAEVGDWALPVLRVEGGRSTFATLVRAPIGDSVTTSVPGASRTTNWELQVCEAVHEARGNSPWDPRQYCALTLGFRFCLALHGSRPLDVENFVKPTVDAIAAGLFLADGQDPETVLRYGYDDSGFRHLLIHRLEDSATTSDEGVAIHGAACPARADVSNC